MPQHVFIRTTKTIYFIQMDFSCIVQFRPEDFNSFVIISYNNLSKLPFIFEIFFFTVFNPLCMTLSSFTIFRIWNIYQKIKLEILSCFHFISSKKKKEENFNPNTKYTGKVYYIRFIVLYLQMENQNHTFCFSSSFH